MTRITVLVLLALGCASDDCPPGMVQSESGYCYGPGGGSGSDTSTKGDDTAEDTADDTADATRRRARPDTFGQWLQTLGAGLAELL